MKEENLIYKCVGDIEDIAAKIIYEKNKEIIDKIWKQIKKQAKNEPLKNYYRISIEEYSPREMRVIKRFFCDYLRFGFSKTLPDDVMTSAVTYYTTYSNSCISLTSTSTATTAEAPKSTPITEFYLTWFND